MQVKDKSNILYGKKLVVCGDSFTQGDFTGFVDENGLQGKDSPVIFDPKQQMYKTYPWWIAERNDMELVNEALCGSTMALSKAHLADPEHVDISDRSPFALERYKKVPLDADYILLQFGLNDMHNTHLGSIDDETNETFFGGFNVVFEYFLTHIPYAKIGTVISNSGLNESYRQAIIAVSKKWGIPYLDLAGDDAIQATLKKNGMCEKAIELRNKVYHVSQKNMHPNLMGHKMISTAYEAFLRRI